METAQDIIVAVPQMARKLETLEATVLNRCGYYQSTIEELENCSRLTDEQLILLGAYLATYQFTQSAQVKNCGSVAKNSDHAISSLTTDKIHLDR